MLTLNGDKSNMMSRVASLFESGRLCDLTLRAVGANGVTRDYEVHRVIMAAASDYWERLLASKWSLEAGRSVVTMGGVDGKALGVVVRHIYGMEVSMGLDTCVHVVNAAGMFLMEDLKNTAVRLFFNSKPTFEENIPLFMGIIIGSMAPLSTNGELPAEKRPKTESKEGKNAGKWQRILCSESSIVHYCWTKFMEDHHIITADEFLLPHLPLPLVVAMLSSDFFSGQEIDVFRWAVKWAEVTGTEFSQISGCIRYSLITPWEFVEVEDSGMVEQDVLEHARRVRRENGAGDDEAHGKWLTPRLTVLVDIKILSFKLPAPASRRPWEQRGTQEKKRTCALIGRSEEFGMCGLRWNVEVYVSKYGDDETQCSFKLNWVHDSETKPFNGIQRFKLAYGVVLAGCRGGSEKIAVSNPVCREWSRIHNNIRSTRMDKYGTFLHDAPSASVRCNGRMGVDEVKRCMEEFGCLKVHVGAFVLPPMQR